MTVFLDLDGTLSDPLPGVERCIRHALGRLGEDPPAGDLGWVIGPPLIESFARLGVRDPERALQLYREEYGDGGLFENRLYEGISQALEALCARGYRLVLVTGKAHVFARRITEHFGLSKWLDDQFGPELDGARNDKADLLAHALQITGADPLRSVMVGDRRHDFRAAASVGMAAIAVAWGYGNAREFAMADAICPAPSGLCATVARVLPAGPASAGPASGGPRPDPRPDPRPGRRGPGARR